MIHTFGDSHSSSVHSGWGRCGYPVSDHHLGPLLCYSFGKYKQARCNIKNYNIRHGDILIFCFGEIDCRCHIHKHITPTNTYKKIIDELVQRYMDAILMNLRFCSIRFKAVCVYNVLPPVQKENTIGNEYLPYLGTNEERKQYVLYFNQRLREACAANRFVFFDVYNDCIDENGYLNKAISDNNVHMVNGDILRKFILKYLA